MEKVVKKRTFRCLADRHNFMKELHNRIDGKENNYKIVLDGENTPVLDGWEHPNTIYCGQSNWHLRLFDSMYFWNNWNNSFSVSVVRITK